MADTKQADKPEAKAEKAEPKLVKMVRLGENGPEHADVHPDEVENYAAGGFEKA